MQKSGHSEARSQEGKRRASRKVSSNVRFLFVQIEKKALEAGLDAADGRSWMMFGTCLKLQEQMSVQEILERVN